MEYGKFKRIHNYIIKHTFFKRHIDLSNYVNCVILFKILQYYSKSHIIFMLISKEEINNMKVYACAICGNKHVKLWRPSTDTKPLICASCAEKRQVPIEYDECTWEKKSDHYFGTPTGRKLPLAKWIVNEKGTIPSCHGPGPKGLPIEMTYQLIVNLKDVSKTYSSGETTMIPAVPDGNGDFYTSVPDIPFKWWEELPTR